LQHGRKQQQLDRQAQLSGGVCVGSQARRFPLHPSAMEGVTGVAFMGNTTLVSAGADGVLHCVALAPKAASDSGRVPVCVSGGVMWRDPVGAHEPEVDTFAAIKARRLQVRVHVHLHVYETGSARPIRAAPVPVDASALSEKQRSESRGPYR
jgi:hypothetical protein